MRRILNDKEMHPNDKREAIRTQYLQMLDRAQQGLQIIRDAETKREYKGP